jgi:ribosomal protein S18 acetylase RimI-like enzyme
MDADCNIVKRALQPPDPRIVVRPVMLADLDALRLTCWADQPLMRCRITLLRALTAAQHGVGAGLVIEENGAVVGFGQWVGHADYAEISDVIISRTLRGRGFGTALIQHLTRSAAAYREQIQLAVFADNLRALHLYLALGFQQFASVQLSAPPQQILYLRLYAGKQKAPEDSSADR